MNIYVGILRAIAAVALALCATPSLAAVSAEEARQLGGPELTLFGSEKTGNKEGTIPEYAGEGVKAPPGWDPKKPGRRPDPFGETPLFSITAANANQYADKLDKMIEVFKRHPDFRMDVYPSHRTATYPKYVIDNTVKNATACKTIDRELKIEGCYGGIPFPLPKTGAEVMWNHVLVYRGLTIFGKGESWVIPTSGDPVLKGRGNYLNNYPFFDPEKPAPRPSDTLYYRYLGVDEAPARVVGYKILLFDSTDLAVPRRAYIYLPGQRWTKLAADFSYDSPNAYSGGIGTMDDAQVFSGPLDRFDFKLVGKKEKFIYYNTFAVNDHTACSGEKLHSTKNFPNPDCIRWELHRVYKVEATLKPEFRHIYTRRVFYFDEDKTGAGQSESYDAKGNLMRIITNFYIPYFEIPGGFAGNHTIVDMTSGVWASQGVMTCAECGWTTNPPPVSDMTFSVGAMTGSGIR